MKLNLGSSSGYTKRRSYRKRRTFFKGQNRARPLAVKRDMYTTISRPLYSPLPAQLKVALRLVEYEDTSVGPTLEAASIQAYSCISPDISGGNARYPSAFTTLMRLYSRAFVDMVQAKFVYQTTAFLTNGIAVDTPVAVDLVGCVIPYGDTLTGTTLTAQFERYASLPDAQLRMLGPPTGGHDQATFYFTVDTKKFLQIASSEEDLSYTSSIGPTTGAITLTPPSLAFAGQIPTIVCMQRNNALQYSQTPYHIRREMTFHITFSSQHAAAMRAENG